MPVKGFSRYIRLFRHIQNPFEYIFNKSNIKTRPLVFITKPNAIKFIVPLSIYQVFKEIFMADVYEIENLVVSIPKNPIVIDIGANAGLFDFLLLSKLNEATIYAYEPMPANIRLLNETINANPAIKNNILNWQMAVTGKEQDELEIFSEDTVDNQVVASIFKGFSPNNTKSIKVTCITLSQIIQQHNLHTIDVLKMDCEGSEYDIIYNTDPSIIRQIKKMVIEVHDVDNEKNNIQYFSNYLKNLGYKIKYEPINSFCYAFEADSL